MDGPDPGWPRFVFLIAAAGVVVVVGLAHLLLPPDAGRPGNEPGLR